MGAESSTCTSNFALTNHQVDAALNNQPPPAGQSGYKSYPDLIPGFKFNFDTLQPGQLKLSFGRFTHQHAKSSSQSIFTSSSWEIPLKSDLSWHTISTTRIFMSARELTIAIKDAIRGHDLTWEKASKYHHYRSDGNTPLVAKTGGVMLSRFLHDSENTSMDSESKAVWVDDAPEPLLSNSENSVADGVCSTTESATRGQDERRIGRIGTYYFTACQILSNRVLHEVHHDLESVYWVLLWALLRHGEYIDPKSKLEDYKNIFIFGDDTQSNNNKTMWIINGSLSLSFPRSAPLTKLMLDFSDLVFRSFGIPRRSPPIPMSHAEVLSVFNDALAMEGWPDADCPRPCKWLDDRGALLGLVSDFHELDSTTPSVDDDICRTHSRTRQSNTPVMPPPLEIRSGTLRSAQKRSSMMIEESDEPEAGPSKANTHSSSKRLKIA